MANRLYREEAYLEKLELLLRTAKELAACRAQLEALDRRGVPEGSVVFSRPVKRYRRKNGEETVYRYTCEYLYIKGKKYYVSKKHRYPKRPRPGTDENDPENPDNRRLLARWLELRTEIRRKVRERKKLVTLYCGVLNAMKPRRLARLEPAAVLEEAWEAYKRSEEYAGLSAELDGSRARRHSEPEEGRYPYQNEIYGGCGERVRSKNELIAAWCARESGLSYTLEPFYPGSNLCADFGLLAGEKEILVEIGGMRTKPEYEARLKEKRELAKRHGRSLVIIDMTDYPDRSGLPQTRLHVRKLRQILQRIRLGTLREGIVTPYLKEAGQAGGAEKQPPASACPPAPTEAGRSLFLRCWFGRSRENPPHFTRASISFQRAGAAGAPVSYNLACLLCETGEKFHPAPGLLPPFAQNTPPFVRNPPRQASVLKFCASGTTFFLEIR